MGFARCIGILTLICVWGATAWSRFEFPSAMTLDERNTALAVFGLGTAPKFLSNTFPLGGHSGLEVSASAESFSVAEVENMRPGGSNIGSVVYPKITIGKGIYNKSDIFFNFIPFNQTTGVSRYGFQYRWSFYQARLFPLNASLLLSGNSANIDNQLTTRTLATDVVLGTRISDVSFLLIAGYLSSTGNFNGGSNGITDSQSQERASVRRGHVAFGVTYQPGKFLVGVSVDRTTQTTLNVKVGLQL